MKDRKLRIDTYGGFAVVVRPGVGWQLGSTLTATQKHGRKGWRRLAARQHPNCSTKTVRQAVEAVSENSSPTVKLDDRICSPVIVQLGACPDALAVLSHDRLQLDVHSMGTSPAVVPRPSFSAFNTPSLLGSGSSALAISLPWTVTVCGSICTELRRKDPPSLLYSERLAEFENFKLVNQKEKTMEGKTQVEDVEVSGLSGTSETAQSQVSVGMGLLAGSTVMLLTLIWGTCVIVGKCDLQDSIAVDGKDTKGFSLTDSGVSTDIWTSYVARIMAISIIPFLVVQIPQVMHSTSGKHLAVLIALIASLLLLISYFLYQVFQPWIQRRRLAYAKHKHVISGILGHLKKQTLGRLLRDDGKPNEEMIEKLFNKIDGNGDRYISDTEMRALIVGIRFDEIHLDENEAMKKVMTEFDTSSDSRIDLPEFIAGITKWLEEAKRSGAASVEAGSTTIKHLDNFHLQTKREHDLLGDQSDEIVEEVENPKWTSIKAACLLLVGTLIAAAFADPLVDAVDNFSDATSIPSFFISFIVLPLATNSSEAVSAIIFASRKRLRSSSLTFSELYGAATMNNLLCLSVFLALVYIRDLTWDFSSEVLVILIVCLVMGAFASFRTTFPLWTSLVAFLLYPFSLALVYILDYICGWS
ncbi:sodium/calcium exchanger family protein / calcium-binding EF hand family protein [Actinidia rufa]|uniref:Sodium/calcium exchanger family protein / calcium-binding EF hand family protein n=1 Tax=Actinidia rufa TaxID=165716 RepID=A0A7J0GNR3_9ERIC|nr:sodium/calcium exchanger family protein / calcium-binding EF hand family protein [Actinidia rufa]